jgi:ribosomal-protein-alanine N-acetyltransferase
MENDRVLLQKLNQSDLPLVAALWTNQAVRRYLGGVMAKDKCAEVLHKMLGDENGAYFTILEKQGKRFAGILSISQYHDGINKELSYQLLPEFWKKGIAFASASIILQYAKETMRLTEIYAETQSKNESSKKLLIKIGMKEINKLVRFGTEQTVFLKIL